MGRFGHHTFLRSGALRPARPLVASDRVRVGLVLTALVATAAAPPTAWLLVPPAALVVAGRVPCRLVAFRVLLLVPLAAGSLVALPLLSGRAGWAVAVALATKLAAASLYLSFLLAATPLPRLVGALEALGCPAVLVEIVRASLRYTGLLVEELGRMRVGMAARGGRGLRGAGALLGSLCRRALARGQRQQAARLARRIGGDGADGDGDGDGRRGGGFPIELDHLWFTYPGAEGAALTDVSLRVPDRGKLALLGANGAGKTTLLLHLNGVLLAQRGAVWIDGRRVTKAGLGEVRAKVGMVFQDPDDQVFGLTVWEDVRSGPEQLGLAPGVVDTRTEEALAAVGLLKKRAASPVALSRGERKRAAIAGVLAAGAEILVFDEPMASLDPAGKDEIAVLLQDLHLAGKTLVVATHDVDFAAAWAETVVLMAGGRPIAGGAPELLVDEAAMAAAGLAPPLVARPFQNVLRQLREPGPPPHNERAAVAWLEERLRNPVAASAPEAASATQGKSHPPATKGVRAEDLPTR